MNDVEHYMWLNDSSFLSLIYFLICKILWLLNKKKYNNIQLIPWWSAFGEWGPINCWPYIHIIQYRTIILVSLWYVVTTTSVNRWWIFFFWSELLLQINDYQNFSWCWFDSNFHFGVRTSATSRSTKHRDHGIGTRNYKLSKIFWSGS